MHVSGVRRVAAALLAGVLALSVAPLAPFALPPEPAFAALPTFTLNAVTFAPSSTRVVAVGAGGTP